MIKKAVILGNTKLNYSWFVKTYRQGLKLNGIETFDIDYKSRSMGSIKKRIMEIKPDVVFTHLSFHNNAHRPSDCMNMFSDLRKSIGVKVVHTCNDARIKDRFMGDISGAFDIAFVGTYPMVENCSKVFKVPVIYSPYSSLTYEKMGNFAPDLAFSNPVFTGSPNAHRTGWADNRAKFISDLQKIMPINIFKTQSAGDLRNRTSELSRSAKCILGVCVGYEIPGYMDVRPFQYLGTGAFMIMRKFNDMDRYIPDYLYVSFDRFDPKIVKSLWGEWKNKNTDKMRNEAFKFMQENHSSKVRIAQVLKELNDL